MESRGCCNSPATPAVMLHEIVWNSSAETLKLPFSSSDDPDMLKTFIQNTQMWISDEFEGKHVVSQIIYFHVICIILSLDCNFFQVYHSLCVGNRELCAGYKSRETCFWNWSFLGETLEATLGS